MKAIINTGRMGIVEVEGTVEEIITLLLEKKNIGKKPVTEPKPVEQKLVKQKGRKARKSNYSNWRNELDGMSLTQFITKTIEENPKLINNTDDIIARVETAVGNKLNNRQKQNIRIVICGVKKKLKRMEKVPNILNDVEDNEKEKQKKEAAKKGLLPGFDF